MVRALHQHLHAVDRDDAHAEQADGSQLQRWESFMLIKLRTAMQSYTSGLLDKLFEGKSASPWTYYKTGILNSQRQTEQPCSDVAL